MANPKFTIGIDEAGRGPLAGSVTLAAICISSRLPYQVSCLPLKDSKKLSEEKREEVFKILKQLKKEDKINFSVSHIKQTLVDKYGLTKCIRTGIKRCLKKLKITPGKCKVLLDGSLRAPKEFKNQKTIIKGDEKVKIIALASIVAKVSRDARMRRLAKLYPEYGFHIHKGYGTKAHYRAIKKYGPSEIHRRTFLGLT